MYPLDRREVAIHLYKLLSSVRKTALLVQVGHSTVHRWLKRPERKTYARSQSPISKAAILIETIRSGVRCDPFISLSELRNRVQEALKVSLSKELIRTVLQKNGFTKKKARFYGEPNDLKAKTLEFLEKRNALLRSGNTFVSVDETSFGRSGAPVFGYSLKGEKLFVRKNVPYLNNTSVVACVTKDGLISKQSLKGAFTKDSFLDFLKSLSLKPDTVVLLDNASIHHSKTVKEFANTQQLTLLFTPSYSPWYNPIEFCFSIVKRAYYKHQDIEASFNKLTKEHCNAFFSKSLNCQQHKI